MHVRDKQIVDIRLAHASFRKKNHREGERQRKRERQIQRNNDQLCLNLSIHVLLRAYGSKALYIIV